MAAMRQVTLEIPDKDYEFFIRLVKNLKFVKLAGEKPSADPEAQLTPSQRKTWANIRKGFEELKLVEQGKMQTRPASALLEELENEGLFDRP